MKTQTKTSKYMPAQLFSKAVTGLSESILEELSKQNFIQKLLEIKELIVFQMYLII